MTVLIGACRPQDLRTYTESLNYCSFTEYLQGTEVPSKLASQPKVAGWLKHHKHVLGYAGSNSFSLLHAI
jgi:hypothetical protein